MTTAHEEAAARFAGLASVDIVSRDGERHTISGRGEDLVTEVIHCLSEHGMRVTAFRTEEPTLEDVFLTLTGHSIRD